MIIFAQYSIKTLFNCCSRIFFKKKSIKFCALAINKFLVIIITSWFNHKNIHVYVVKSMTKNNSQTELRKNSGLHWLGVGECYGICTVLMLINLQLIVVDHENCFKSMVSKSYWMFCVIASFQFFVFLICCAYPLTSILYK